MQVSFTAFEVGIPINCRWIV